MSDSNSPAQDKKHQRHQERNNFLQQIADYTPELLFVIDLGELEVIYINHKVEQFLGLEASNVYGQGDEIFSSVLHPDDYQRRMENLEFCKQLPDKKEIEVEVRLKAANGNWNWFRIRDKVFKRRADGSVAQTIGIAQNIHEQKVADEKFQEEHRRLKDAQGICHIGSFERPLPGELIICSEECLKIHGLKSQPEVITTTQFLSYVHPDDQEAFQEAVHHTHATGEPLDVVNRIVRPDGSIRHVHRRSIIIQNAQGTPIRVYGTIQDITELHKSEQTIQQMLNGSIAAISLLESDRDEQGNINDFIYRGGNKAAEKILNRPAKEMLGKSLLELWPCIKDVLFDKFVQVVESGEPLQIEKFCPDEYLNHWFDVSAVRNGDGFIMTLHDITAMKLAEEEVLQVKDELAQRATNKYFELFNSIDQGFAIAEVIFDGNETPVDYRILEVNPRFKALTGISPEEVLGGKTIRQIKPDLEEKWFQYGRLVLTGEPLYFEEHSEALGNRWFGVHVYRTEDPEKERLAILYNDITDRKRAEEQITQQNAVLEGINRIFREALTSQTEEELGRVCLNVMEEVTGSRIGFMGEINQKTAKLEDIAISDRSWKEFGVENTSFPKKKLPVSLIIHGIYGRVLLDNKGFFTNDPPSHPDSIGTPSSHPKLRSFLGVPLIQDGKAIGMIGLANREGGYGPKELEMAEALAPAIVQAFLRKRTEEALRNSEEQFRAVVDLVPDLLWSKDAQGATDWYNKQWLEYTGQDFEVGEDYTWLNATHPEDRDRSLQAFQAAITAGEMLRIEHRIRRHDGVYRWFLIQKRPMKNDTGKIFRWYGSATDVHEERMAMETLRHSEEKFRFMANTIPQMVWITDAEGQIEFTNKVFLNYTGAPETPVRAQEMVNLCVHPDDISITMDRWGKAIEHKKTLILEHRIKSAQGEYRWFLVRAEPFIDPDTGKIKRWFGTSTDIHDNKLLEETLIKAKEEAEEAARAKEEFLSTMSHEIRTPLNAVVGFTHLLLQQNPREDQKESLNGLSYSSRNLMSLINDILDFSKIEAGKVALEENEFDLLDLMFSLKQAHQPEAIENDIQLKLSLDDEIPESIIGDQLKLSQILHNLLGNAVKFTQQGLVSLEVNLRKQEGENIWLDFAVVDTGIGIAEKKINHIFEKFSQADSSTVRHYGGTGLGLSITKMLLELMGSQIKVESQEGKGSRFYFTLAVKAGSRSYNKSEISKEPEEEIDVQNLKILLVEDVSLNRMVITKFLKEWWGIVPDEAVTGKEAVEKARNKAYDIILMDVRMPEMNGYEATRLIRSQAGKENTPIIALTADSGEDIKQKPEAVFFTDVITKPFDPNDLRRTILKYRPVQSSESTQEAKLNEEEGQSNFQEVEKELKADPEDVKTLYKLTYNNLKEYKEVFTEALTERNLKKLGDMKHKSTILIDTFGFDDLKTFLQESQILLEENADASLLQKAQKKGEVLFDQKMKEIQARLEQPKG